MSKNRHPSIISSILISLPLFRQTITDTKQLFQFTSWRASFWTSTRTLLSFAAAAGFYYLFLSEQDKGKVMDMAYAFGCGLLGIAALGAGTYILHLIASPFRLHYAKLRGLCPDSWLHEIAVGDSDSLNDRIAVVGSDTRLHLTSDDGPYITLQVVLINASVIAIRPLAVSGRLKLQDGSHGREIVLPTPEIIPLREFEWTANDSDEIRHGATGRIVFKIYIDESQAREVQKAMSGSEHANRCCFVFMNNCPITVKCRPGKEQQLLLPKVPMRSYRIHP